MTNGLALAAKRRLGEALVLALGKSPEGQWREVLALALAGRDRSAFSLGLLRRLQLARKGFLPIAHALYDLEANDPAEYLTDRERMLAQGIDGPLSILLGDKLAFSLLLRSVGAPTPAVEAVLVRGTVHPLTGSRDGDGWLQKRLAPGERLVLKPARGGGGKGVFVLEGRPEGLVVNGEGTDWGAFQPLLAELDDYIATTFARQAAYAAAIHPGSTNTIRVLTVLDADGGPRVAAATHRFGTSRSVPVDTWKGGGVAARVDPETGGLGPVSSHPSFGPLKWQSAHPDTGVQIEGTFVPGWTDVRDGVLALAGRLGFLPYVGWDVLVTDGGYVLIEGNHYSNVHMLQVHTPLLRDPEVVDFYRRHGVLSDARADARTMPA